MMELSLATQVINEHLSDPNCVNLWLNGEGEPLMYPHLWDVVKHVKHHFPHINISFTTNGSALTDVNIRLISQFDISIRVSLDSTSVEESDRIGRHNIDKVISNIRTLVSHTSSVTIATVDYGQDLAGVRDLATELNIQHAVQQLNPLAVYHKVYTDQFNVARYTKHVNACSFLDQHPMIYYSVNGVKMPCGFIKDLATFPGYDEIYQSFVNQSIPECCTGCRYLINKNIVARKSE
jgi:MoaA/NifB/PqqE/SkfB family radical SAM enzyme